MAEAARASRDCGRCRSRSRGSARPRAARASRRIRSARTSRRARYHQWRSSSSAICRRRCVPSAEHPLAVERKVASGVTKTPGSAATRSGRAAARSATQVKTSLSTKPDSWTTQELDLAGDGPRARHGPEAPAAVQDEADADRDAGRRSPTASTGAHHVGREIPVDRANRRRRARNRTMPKRTSWPKRRR